MRRLEGLPGRLGFRNQVAQEGLVFVDTELGGSGKPEVVSYWREHTCAELTESETDLIGHIGAELFRMCVTAGDYAIEHDLFDKMGIPPWAVRLIKETWKDDTTDRYWPMTYGRFDLRLDLGSDGMVTGAQLLEYNADTPTSLVESAVIQWNWLIFNHPQYGQYNELYEKLVDAWVLEITRFEKRTGRTVDLVHCAWTTEEKSGEDLMTVGLMASAAEEAAQHMGSPEQPKFRVKIMAVEDIKLHERIGETVYGDGHNGTAMGFFTDPEGEVLQLVFKLYPWEWLVRDTYGKTVCWNMLQPDGTVWMEPPYKMLWSNKGLLAILWKLFKDDPVRSQYLLPAYFEGEEPPGFRDNCARKPLLGREGNSVILTVNGEVIDGEPGDYGKEGFVLQQYAPLPAFPSLDGKTYHLIAGVWTVSDAAVALCFRESPNMITNNTSYFLPHRVRRGM
jgi:glutathionylspermidine synthase